jgi:biotin-(acetyl-CoA carboxylase) ligase
MRETEDELERRSSREGAKGEELEEQRVGGKEQKEGVGQEGRRWREGQREGVSGMGEKEKV